MRCSILARFAASDDYLALRTSWTAPWSTAKVRVRCTWEASSAPSSPRRSTRASRARSCSSSRRSTTQQSATRDPRSRSTPCAPARRSRLPGRLARGGAGARALVRAGRRRHRRHRRRRARDGGEERSLPRSSVASRAAWWRRRITPPSTAASCSSCSRSTSTATIGRVVPRGRPRAGRRRRHRARATGGQRHAPAPEAWASRCPSARSIVGIVDDV